MNKSFKYEYSDIDWCYNMEHFDRWCKGQTGFPIGSSRKRHMDVYALCYEAGLTHHQKQSMRPCVNSSIWDTCTTGVG